MTKIDVEEFERRAAAGQKPILPWRLQNWASQIPGMVRPFVEIPAGRERDFILRPLTIEFEEYRFRTLAAAQLAGEHLLREATRPLFAQEVARVEELKAALSGLVEVNETEAGDDPAEWAAAMLAARKALGGLNE
jgi:hypothetical protein